MSPSPLDDKSSLSELEGEEGAEEVDPKRSVLSLRLGLPVKDSFLIDPENDNLRRDIFFSSLGSSPHKVLPPFFLFVLLLIHSFSFSFSFSVVCLSNVSSPIHAPKKKYRSMLVCWIISLLAVRPPSCFSVTFSLTIIKQ